MIPAALLLLAAAAPEAVEAERAFARMAQTEGQWTAFRAFAAPDAVMFVPEEVRAQEWLKDKADPRQSVMWWPARAYLSCDGKTAVTTGPWIREGGRSGGYFTTVWRKQADGSWKWLLDHGDLLASRRAAGDQAEVRRATCGKLHPDSLDGWQGTAADNSLRWRWRVESDGSRTVEAELWDGRTYRNVISDKVGP
jgi:hypothetical protein